MRRTIWLGLILGLALPAFAQHRTMRTFSGVQVPVTNHRYNFGYGNVVFPGSGGPTLPNFSITNPGFATNLGGIVSGFRPYTGASVGRGRSRFGAAYPIAVPVFVDGGYGGYGGYYAEPQQPNVIVVSPQQPAPAPVIIQNFTSPPQAEEQDQSSSGRSGVNVYQAPSAQFSEPDQSSEEPTIYLIAYKDGSIHAAIAYWGQGDTLHYITPQGQPNQVSLSLIDRNYSQQLNRGRNLEFHLPMVRK